MEARAWPLGRALALYAVGHSLREVEPSCFAKLGEGATTRCNGAQCVSDRIQNTGKLKFIFTT